MVNFLICNDPGFARPSERPAKRDPPWFRPPRLGIGYSDRRVLHKRRRVERTLQNRQIWLVEPAWPRLEEGRQEGTFGPFSQSLILTGRMGICLSNFITIFICPPK